MSRLLMQSIVVAGLLFLSSGAFAALVEAEGQAIIRNDDISLARQMALQEAMRNAALQGSARVQSSTHVNNSALLADQVNVRADAGVSEVQVLDEWADEEDTYHVLIRASVDAAPAAESGVPYRRKVAVTQFRIADRGASADLPQFEILLAQELRRRLDSDRGIMALDATQYVLPESAAAVQEQGPHRENLLVTTAENLGVQLLVSGTIRETGERYQPINARTHYLEFDVVITDGISGREVARHRINQFVDYWYNFQFLKVKAPMMTAKFFASPFGKAVDAALNAAVAQLRADINRLPFAARVVQVQDDLIYFDAGAAANVQVGDRLSAYHLADTPLTQPLTNAFYGYPESPAGYLTVMQVQPGFAVAQRESTGAVLQPGDIIRFAW